MAAHALPRLRERHYVGRRRGSGELPAQRASAVSAARRIEVGGRAFIVRLGLFRRLFEAVIDAGTMSSRRRSINRRFAIMRLPAASRLPTAWRVALHHRNDEMLLSAQRCRPRQLSSHLTACRE